MTRDHSGNYHFSNSVLEGYIRFVQNYNDKTRYVKFLKEINRNEEWLLDANLWHDADFLEKFYSTLVKLFPEHTGIAFEGARYLYTQKKFQRFTALAGLLLKPELLWSKLPSAAGRMNLYNQYRFELASKKIAYSRGILTQTYLDPSRKLLNASLCDAARGSTVGILNHLGYNLLDLSEPVCVKRGHPHCEFHITWVNRPFLLRTVFGGMLWFAAQAVAARFLDLNSLNATLLAGTSTLAGLSLMTVIRDRKTRIAAFQYQEKTLQELRAATISVENLNRKLIEYQKHLTEAFEAASIGELSFSYIHDMAAPTTLLSHYSDIMLEAVKDRHPDEGDMIKYSTAIERATRRLINLQSMLRSVARNRASTTPVTVDLRKTVADCLDLFEPFTESKKIEVTLEAGESPVMLDSLEGALETIVLNVVQNAIKAMTGTPRRKLHIRVGAKESGAELVIQDSGPGIPPERLSHIWERFGSTTGSYPAGAKGEPLKLSGSGFGMYNIKKVVDQLGASVDIASDSSGTRFEFVFPRLLDLQEVETGPGLRIAS